MNDTDKKALSQVLRATIDTLGARVGEPAMRYLVTETATKGVLSQDGSDNEGVQLVRQLLVN